MDLVINGRFLTQSVTGVQRYARELVQALDDIMADYPEIRITVVSPRLTGPMPAWRNIALRQMGYFRGQAWEQFELPWYARGRTLFCPGNTAPVISLLCRLRVVVTIHDLSYKYFPEAYRLAFRLWYGLIVPLALRRASCVITVSQSERHAIIAHYPSSAVRLYAIANGGLPDNSARMDKFDRGKSSYVLYVGSLSKRKNFPRMFEVACRLARSRDIQFIFIGDVSTTLVTTAAKVPDDIKSKITFVGAVSDLATLMSYYRNAECLLFPSLYESSGLPPIEAMACGCPVVASDIPALRERCGNAAIYCDPHDSDSIAAAVLSLWDDRALRSQLRVLGLSRAAEFTWRTCARETLNLINRLN